MTADERLAWLTRRQKGLGGTDMAAICGVGFSTPQKVYAEKVADRPDDTPGSPIMRMGLATEDLNAAVYAERTGARLASPGMFWAPDHPWAFFTSDRVRLEPGDGPERFQCAVELKYAGPFFGDEWGPDGSDEIKDGYTVQATWEAQVLRLNGHDVRRTDVSAISGAGEHRVYPVPFDERLGQMLLELGAAFWRRVEGRLGVDGWEPPLALTEQLVRYRPDTSVPLGADAQEIADEIGALAAVQKDGKEAERAIRGLKDVLALMLGDAQEGRLPDGRRVKQSVVSRDGYTVEPSTYRTVRILNAKKGKGGA